MTAQPANLQRKEPASRKRVLMRGTVFAPNGAHVAWIRDISQTGAQVSTDVALPEKCDVIFKRGPIFAAAQVAWVKGNGAGLTFYRPMAENELLQASVPNPDRDR